MACTSARVLAFPDLCNTGATLRMDMVMCTAYAHYLYTSTDTGIRGRTSIMEYVSRFVCSGCESRELRSFFRPVVQAMWLTCARQQAVSAHRNPQVFEA